jgi:hypothetical protein
MLGVSCWRTEGINMTSEEEREINRRFDVCLQRCSDAYAAGSDRCVAAFPTPPNSNIEPALACLKTNSTVNSLCGNRCATEFAIAMGRDPSRDSSTPTDESVKAVKRSTRGAVANSLKLIGLQTGLVGGFFTLSTIQATRIVGGLFALGGAAAFSAGDIVRDIADDPPDRNYEQFHLPRPIDIERFMPPMETRLIGLVVLRIELFSHLEAALIALERSAGAALSGDAEKQRAQLRVFAILCREVTRICLEMEPLRQECAIEVRDRFPDVVIQPQDLRNLRALWQRDGVDPATKNMLQLFATERHSVEELAQGLLTTQMRLPQAPLSLFEYLLRTDLQRMERRLIAAFSKI